MKTTITLLLFALYCAPSLVILATAEPSPGSQSTVSPVKSTGYGLMATLYEHGKLVLLSTALTMALTFVYLMTRGPAHRYRSGHVKRTASKGVGSTQQQKLTEIHNQSADPYEQQCSAFLAEFESAEESAKLLESQGQHDLAANGYINLRDDYEKVRGHPKATRAMQAIIKKLEEYADTLMEHGRVKEASDCYFYAATFHDLLLKDGQRVPPARSNENHVTYYANHARALAAQNKHRQAIHVYHLAVVICIVGSDIEDPLKEALAEDLGIYADQLFREGLPVEAKACYTDAASTYRSTYKVRSVSDPLISGKAKEMQEKAAAIDTQVPA